MPTDDEVERRLAALEAVIPVIQQEAAAARVLAGAADRDVSLFSARLDAHQRLLSALRETQIEDGRRFDALTTEMRTGFAKMAVGQTEILRLLQSLTGESSG